MITAVTALYAARVLGPAQFGVWSVLQVLFMYTAQGHLGSANAMMREVPLLRSRGDEVGAQNIVNSTLSFITLSSLAVTLFAGAAVWSLYRQSRAVALGSMWLVFVQLQSVFFQFYCRANSSFKIMAAFSTTQALITLPLSFWLIPRLGIAGYLFALSAGFSIIPLAIATRPGIRMRINLVEWRGLLQIGMPMLPGALMLYLNMSIERLVLASALTSAAVGIFAAGAFLFQIGASVWELVVYTWYSRLAAIYGRTGSVDALARVMREFLPSAIWVSSLGQGALLVILPWAMTQLLPSYGPSVAIAEVLVAVMNLWGIAQFLSFALTIIDRQKRSVALQSIFLIAKLALVMGALLLRRDPVAVAVASASALTLYAGMTWLQWWRLAGKVFPQVGLPALMWALPILVAGVLSQSSRTVSLTNALGSLAVYAMCMAVLTCLLHTQIGLRRGLIALRGAE